jgi:hypothetical protein
MKQFFKSLVGFFVKYRVLYVVAGIGFVVIATYTVFGVLAGRERIRQMNALYISGDAMVGSESAQLFELRKQNAFELSRLELAKSDSVALIINLVDSIVTLDLKGLSVHKAKIVHFSKSSLLDALHPDAELAMLSKPMKVKNSYSTIVKEPRIYRKAPKDTIEAAQQELTQDTLAARMPSVYILDLDNDIHISILHQIEEGFSYSPFMKEQKRKQFNAATDSIIKGKLPEYIPSITIELAKSDATTIFRAIPHHALVAILY